MAPTLGRLIIYTKKMTEMTEFYCRHFGYNAVQSDDDRLVELQPKGSGATILLHPASKGQREGQALVKLVFDVEDVEAFCMQASQRGVDFGKIHRAEGYSFANAKDPSNNSVSVSSRAFAKPAR